MRVTENAPNGRSLRVRFVAVAIEFLSAERAYAACNIKRHKYMVARFQLFYRRADFFNYSRKFMPESRADPCIWYKSMI
jgi:hypothetical protein